MKILQIAPPFFPIFEGQGYGGIERVILDLIKEHSNEDEIYLAAPKGTSIKGAKIYETVPPFGYFERKERIKRVDYSVIEHIRKLLDIIGEVNPDIIHNHDDYFFPFMDRIKHKSLLTIHCPYEDFWNISTHKVFKNQKLVAVSKRQKEIYEKNGVKVHDVIYNGIDTEKYAFNEIPTNFLLSLSSIRPEKGQDISIKIFDSVKEKLGFDLVISGNIGIHDFFENKIKPRIEFDLSKEHDKFRAYCKLKEQTCKQPIIVYTGEVNDKQKIPLFQNAKAFLFPITIEESLGLVAIESLSCGTPVISTRIGGAQEIITEKTGYLLRRNLLENNHSKKKEEYFLNAVEYCINLSRQDCRERAVSVFSRKKMADNYLRIYRNLLNDII